MTELYGGEIVFECDYEDENYKQFCDDMLYAGLECKHYFGRFFYEGPSVVVNDIQEALSNTKVKCEWDNMALDYVVYPK